MTDQARVRRVAGRIQRTVARMLAHGVKDPRLGFVTITDVRVTGDLQHATVYYTVLGSAEEQERSTQALQSARGLIRSAVGRDLGIRLTPTLDFVADDLPRAAASLDEAVERARARDAQIAARTEPGRYAGDADPYRHPEERRPDDA